MSPSPEISMEPCPTSCRRRARRKSCHWHSSGRTAEQPFSAIDGQSSCRRHLGWPRGPHRSRAGQWPPRRLRAPHPVSVCSGCRGFPTPVQSHWPGLVSSVSPGAGLSRVFQSPPQGRQQGRPSHSLCGQARHPPTDRPDWQDAPQSARGSNPFRSAPEPS